MNLHIGMAALLAAGMLGGQPAAVPKALHHHSMNVSGDGDGPVSDCSGLHIRFDDRDAAMRSEERTIARTQGTLRVQSEVNGGVQVQGWDKDSFSVTTCKAVDASRNDPDQVFSQIRLSIEDGKVSVTGPTDRENWTVYLLIRAPKGANIELHSKNGPLSIYNLDAKLTARAVNGPISLRGFSGDADISAVNGPIDLTGNSGKLRIHTENGPLSVSLKGDTWTGSGLEADAENGPLTLRVPRNYQSSVLVESNGNSPVSCQASVCNDATQDLG
jgi:DUF4097 and DUF4098 domain-containing protein YvlB